MSSWKWCQRGFFWLVLLYRYAYQQACHQFLRRRYFRCTSWRGAQLPQVAPGLARVAAYDLGLLVDRSAHLLRWRIHEPVGQGVGFCSARRGFEDVVKNSFLFDNMLKFAAQGGLKSFLQNDRGHQKRASRKVALGT